MYLKRVQGCTFNSSLIECMKLYKSLFFVAALFVILNSSAQDLSFEDYNPKSTLVVPGGIIKKAKFPFIDVHGHQYRMSNQDLSPVILAMDTLNMGIMVNLSGRSGSNLKKSVQNIKDNYPNRFVVFANVDFDNVGKKDWTKNAVAQLRKDITNGARGLKIYKSLGLRYKDTDGN